MGLAKPAVDGAIEMNRELHLFGDGRGQVGRGISRGPAKAPEAPDLHDAGLGAGFGGLAGPVGVRASGVVGGDPEGIELPKIESNNGAVVALQLDFEVVGVVHELGG